MTSVVTNGPGPSLDVMALELPPEPVDVRNRVRDELLGGADWRDDFGEELGLGDVLWAAWGERLAGGGMERAAFAAVISGYRRELWFWLLGDRIWEQVATGLAGRLVRRLPAGSSS